MWRRDRRWLGVAGLVVLALAIAGYTWLFHDLPSPEDLHAYASVPSSKIYDRHGRLLYEMPPPYTGSHTPVSLSEIPLALRQATIALEDKDFYTNPGYDWRGIARAVWFNLRNSESEYVMGGSTLTQQLVRNLMLSPGERQERTLRRKLRELVLAVQLTRRYSKDEILTYYLNETYYGNMAYGVEAAAQAYYGKHARDLDLAECAMLAVLPHAPAYWNPLENPTEAQERQALVLDRMVAEGYVSAAEAELAKAEPLAFAATRFPVRAPHFVMYVRALLERELGLERVQAGGLHVHTTLDLALNERARDLMRHQLHLLANCNHTTPCPPGGYNVRNAAVLALDPRSGEILTMVGSPDYFSAGFPTIAGAVNGTLTLRQPGSAIKPLTYAAAFAGRSDVSQGPFTPATMLWDVRTSFVTREGTPYVPLNYDLTFRGPVRLREALGSSYNLIAVKVLDTIGVETLTEMARRLGITTFDNSERWGLALTLGGGEVRLLELAAAYGAFANGGHRVTPWSITAVEDEQGHNLWRAPCTESAAQEGAPNCLGPQVLDPRVAYLISDVLSDDVARIPAFGEDSVLALAYAGTPVAVKTGTTTDFRDNWTVGYTPDLVVGVWVGNADNEPMQQISGITGAAPLWRDVMEAALEGNGPRRAQAFPQPEGLVEMEVCALSGLRPQPHCPHRITETFIRGTEPVASCDLHRRVGDEVYLDFPAAAQEWARAQGLENLLIAGSALASTENPEGAAVTPSPHRERPALLLTAPDEGAVYRVTAEIVPEAQRIAVIAQSDLALSRVLLLRNGEQIANLTAPPYMLYWQLEPGRHTFQAVGTDAAGHEIQSNEVSITVRE